MSTPLAGQTQGKYRILAEIGRGGMAVVYKAQDTSLGRPVAVKVLAPHLAWDAEFVRRFHAEARAIAALRHPNIVTVYEIAQWGDRPCLVMEYLDGRPLAEALRQDGPASARRVARLLGQVAQALDYAHGRGVIHRDVKPANIIVDADGHATLTDFGLAKALEGSRLTQSGVLMGTPAYLSPEQAKGTPASALSDQYSLGVVAYEMLSGRLPFQADTPALLVYQHVYEPPPDLRQLTPGLPPALVAAVNRALAKDPGQRFPRVGDFGQALVEAARGSGASTPPAEPPRRPAQEDATRHVERRPTPPATPPRRPTPPPPTPRASAVDDRWLLPLVALLLALGLGGLFFANVRNVSTGGAPTATVAVAPAAPVAVASPPPTVIPVIAPIRATSSPTASASQRPSVNADNVNLRPDPSARNAPVTTLTKGQSLTLLGRSEDGQWLHVTTPTHQQGWVAVRLVDGAGGFDRLAVVTPPPATTAPGAATPRATATRAPAAPTPPPPPEIQVTLSGPANGGTPINGLVPFAWRASQPLAAGEIFDVQVCQGAGCTPQYGVTTVTTLSTGWCPAEKGWQPGVYRWRVVVMDATTKESKGPPSATWSFDWQGGCGQSGEKDKPGPEQSGRQTGP